MTVPTLPDSSGSGPAGLETDIIPLGERAWQSILNHVVEIGDEAETTYLEVKSTLDMSSKVATAKIAKFLLAAANRRPNEASPHFKGYAVLMIGAQEDSAPGVPRGTEAHELQDRLSPYLGPLFPPFEFGRIAVDSGHEVLFVIAQPPKEGQTPFPCHKDYQGEDGRDNLTDGAIYVRGASNTRQARSGEVLALVERARSSGKPPIKLEVEVLGPICRVEAVEELLEDLRKGEELEFIKQTDPSESSLASASFLVASTAFGSPRPLSSADREKALETWRRNKTDHLAAGREHFLGVALSGAGVRVVSRGRFVAKPQLIITFHGCEVIDCLDHDDADYNEAIEPVVRAPHPLGAAFSPSSFRPIPWDYPVVWNNTDSDAEVLLTPESFRPNVPWSSDQDDYVLVTRDPLSCSVEVSWVLTEDGNDTETSGTFNVPTAELLDAFALFNRTFLAGD